MSLETQIIPTRNLAGDAGPFTQPHSLTADLAHRYAAALPEKWFFL